MVIAFETQLTENVTTLRYNLTGCLLELVIATTWGHRKVMGKPLVVLGK